MRSTLVFVLAGAAWLSAGATVGTGLRGVVMRGPTSPVCVVGQPCSEPAAYVTLVFSRGGVDVGRVTTTRDGRYRLRLAAGDYGVRLRRRPTIGRGLEPTRVRVVAGVMRRVDFSIDTGIR